MTFADRLRELADTYDANPDLPVPAVQRITIYARGENARDAYVASRLAFPAASVHQDDAFVYLETPFVTYGFWRMDVADKKTVVREVTDYVLPQVPA